MNTIWSNYHLDISDWKDFLAEEYPDVVDTNDQWDLVYQLNDLSFDDEKANLSHLVFNKIIVIGDLGLWYGRRMGYKEIPSGKVADCLAFDSCDYYTWYVEDDEFKCEAIHHDGTNYYRYRAIKDDVDEDEVDELLNLIYSGAATEDDIDKITVPIGRQIAEVYGWK